VPIYSLYGETRRRLPKACRESTRWFRHSGHRHAVLYVSSTMGNAMRAAAEHKLRFVVLDRPNPINGVDVAGPVLTPAASRSWDTIEFPCGTE